MLENTGNATDKVPNTLALVAAQMVVEKSREFQEQARQAAEEARRAENARVRELAHSAANDQGSVENPVSAKTSAADDPAPAPVEAPPPDSRGAVVDLNV